MRLVATVLALASATGGAVHANDDAVREAIRALVPQANIEQIKPSAVAGFQEVTVDNNILYVSNDGKHLFQGALFDITRRVDLTEQSKAAHRAKTLAGIDKTKTISFPAKNEKHHVTIFTDIDCGYCRKLHQEVAQINDLGISVDYLFFPRNGLQSDAYNKAVSVWCATDRKLALTDAKAGKPIEHKMCANPIADDFQIGLKLGVGAFGTPAMYADDGRQLGGYLAAPALLERLNQAKPAKVAR
ncbi:MAG: thioredoxin fold domain-containing protein [Ahniella sp.]|nr:thioredoxin fold domain-containing protein [Ahniella sp.]